MSHLVIARKYRPGTFASVRGQDHVTRTLSNSISRGRVAHAYLFSGPRGVGKTSMARIFAKALNCAAHLPGGSEGVSKSKRGAIDTNTRKGSSAESAHLHAVEPCGECQNCTEIAAGTSFAVREIDGASHNSVDNVRDLIDSFRALPPPGLRYKVYIIDEVHMLSIAAFNALLKSLEEPPPNTIFILATTEAHRIPETVLSRCQRYDFRAISFETIVEQLQDIAEKEKQRVEPEVFRIVGRLADGSMRDAQSLFERLQVFCEGTITAQAAGDALGVIDRAALLEISQAIVQHDPAKALAGLERAIAKGIDLSLLIRDLASFWRELLLVGYGSSEVAAGLGFSPDELAQMQKVTSETSREDLVVAVEHIRNGCDGALRTSFSRAALEALVVRAACRAPTVGVERLVGEIAARGGSVSGGAERRAAPIVSQQPVSGGVISSPGIMPSGGMQGVSVGSVVPTSANREEKTPRVTDPESVPAAIASPEAIVPSQPLDWPAFVALVASRSKVLCEHLKRVSPTVFVPGRLFATGATFTIAALELEENRKKLSDILAEVFSTNAVRYTGKWSVKFSAGKPSALQVPEKATTARLTPGGVPADSIEGQDRAIAEDRRAKTTEALSEHPSVKALQKFFPGSQIDKIRLTE